MSVSRPASSGELPCSSCTVHQRGHDFFAPVHALGAAKHTQGLTFLLKDVFGGHRCTILLDTGASSCFVDNAGWKKSEKMEKAFLLSDIMVRQRFLFRKSWKLLLQQHEHQIRHFAGK